MSRVRWAAACLAVCFPVGLLLGACGEDVVETTGTNTLTVEVTNLVGAQGSELTAELSQNVDYLQTAPVWSLLTTSVTASPFSYSDTVPQLPEGEFDLSVVIDGGERRLLVDGVERDLEASSLAVQVLGDLACHRLQLAHRVLPDGLGILRFELQRRIDFRCGGVRRTEF